MAGGVPAVHGNDPLGPPGLRAFDQLHLENLKRVLERSGLSPAGFTSEDLEELNRAWERLPAWPDSRDGLHQLKGRYVIWPLSNGNTALLVNMGKNAGLPWDAVVGLDLLRVYKPDPAAYLGAASVLRLDPGEVMLVAAHNGDLGAARDAGLATAFVPRATEHGPGQTTDLVPASDWDAVAADLIQLARALTLFARVFVQISSPDRPLTRDNWTKTPKEGHPPTVS
jgi:2-haloacid dehalogenase